MESQMDSPRKACGFPQRTDLRPALRVHSLPTPGAYGWKPLRAFHTAPCRVASAARFIAKIFPTLRNRPRRNSYTTRWDAGRQPGGGLPGLLLRPVFPTREVGALGRPLSVFRAGHSGFCVWARQNGSARAGLRAIAARDVVQFGPDRAWPTSAPRLSPRRKAGRNRIIWGHAFGRPTQA